MNTKTRRAFAGAYLATAIALALLAPVQQIVERSGTLFFSFQDLDSTKPAGPVKIRVETIAHYLKKYSAEIIAKKKAASPAGCPLLPGA